MQLSAWRQQWIPKTVPTQKLNSGFDIPLVGWGTFSANGDLGTKSTHSALAAGYRVSQLPTALAAHCPPCPHKLFRAPTRLLMNDIVSICPVCEGALLTMLDNDGLFSMLSLAHHDSKPLVLLADALPARTHHGKRLVSWALSLCVMPLLKVIWHPPCQG